MTRTILDAIYTWFCVGLLVMACGRGEMNPKCNHCGRFYRYEDGDEYTHFGSAADLEPPDPIFMCPACSKRDEDEQVKRGWPDNAWMKSRSQHNAAKRLGFIEIAPRGAGWTQWHKATEPLPDGYEKVE